MIALRIAPADAAHALAGLSAADPRGLLDEGDIADMCQRGECVRLVDGHGRVGVFLLRMHPSRGAVWIEAAGGGGGDDMCAAMHGMLVRAGARSIAFQTARPGLVRRTRRLGYEQTGVIMRWSANA